MKVKIEALPKRANKNDYEYYNIEISGRGEKSEVRKLIQDLDNLIHH